MQRVMKGPHLLDPFSHIGPLLPFVLQPPPAFRVNHQSASQYSTPAACGVTWDCVSLTIHFLPILSIDEDLDTCAASS